MSDVKFGPAGNSESFYAEGHKSSMESAAWVKGRGLELFEYSFGQGYRMSSEVASAIGKQFASCGVELSVHAPYFINFANPDEEMFGKSLGYLRTGVKFLKLFGAKRLVFHSGSCGKMAREEAVGLIRERFQEFAGEFEAQLDEGMFLCPETMGKTMQIGTWKEVIDLCTISKIFLPTFDFGHINALGQGELKTADDFQRIFDYCQEKLGRERTQNAHIHFSKIQYGAKGEIRHLTFEDDFYGPNFEPLAEVLVKNNLSCHVICESNGTMAEDAATMKKLYLDAKETERG